MLALAWVDDGEWTVQCPNCKRFALTITRAFRRFTCGMLPDGHPAAGGCGWSGEVQFPIEADAIEAVLSVRPKQNRYWFADESLATLRIENAAHGLESGLR
jgi:hypothetical protein